MVRHRFNVWVDVPSKSGDGWSKYPDYSSDEVGRQIRRSFHVNGIDAVVELGETTEMDDIIDLQLNR
jgi:hypothetical protein